MDTNDVVAALNQIREARRQWAKKQSKFNADAAMLMRRLIMEGAIRYMSVDDIAEQAGITRNQARTLFRNEGLDPRQKKPQLAKHSAAVLAENAALLGIEPAQMDLMSPLAYLPAGSLLRQEVEKTTLSAVTEIDRLTLLTSLLVCDWCGAGRSHRCVEWEKPIETMHEERFNEAKVVLATLGLPE